jgi:hypothetical protein
MGDRTNCWLTISGVLHTPADVEKLRTALRDASCNGHAFLKTGFDLQPGPVDLEDDFHFDEMNYGEMDGDLAWALRELGLEYVWHWGAGDDYGPGLEIQTWFPEDNTKENTVDGELFLLLSDLAKPERIAQLQAFEQRHQAVVQKGLVYAPSAHSLLAHFANDAEAMERWKAHRDLWNDDDGEDTA